MSAIVTDQFRILNAANFVDSVQNSSNSYYIFVGLSNPTTSGFGRNANWNTNTPDPTDNIDYSNHYESTILYGKKITSANIRRVIRKIDWISGQKYEMYRPDYSISYPSPNTGSMRLYDANYYVINSDYKVYICIDNGSSGINTTGNSSQVEPTFTDLEPAKLNDGYVWKYLYTISPSDVIKFDSTEYITVPNNWQTSTDTQISSVKNNGNSSLNENQIKKVYIKNGGGNYDLSTGQSCNILGDGSGGTVSLEVDSATGSITNAIVTSGGKNYTYGLIDLGTTASNTPDVYAELIPIIPPSKGHGYDIYKELGADKVLVYARFDDTSKQFPTDTKFAQVGILKNPTVYDSSGISTNLYNANDFSSVYAMRFSSTSGSVSVGDKIKQSVSGGIAYGYVVSYDPESMVLKYSQDRSLYFSGGSGIGYTDFVGMTSYFSDSNTILPFTGYNAIDPTSTKPVIKDGGGFSGTISSFVGITTTISTKILNLGVYFTNGLANPEINNKSGDIIYTDNRPIVSRSSRQKEDFKIILEF